MKGSPSKSDVALIRFGRKFFAPLRRRAERRKTHYMSADAM
jgi:hypothetical protein